MTPRTVTRTWDVLLIGGASGSGKTSVSYRVAEHFKIGITEVDDFQVILESMTTPDQQPEMHWWRTQPEAERVRLPVEEIVEHTIAVCRVMARAMEAVIANHLASNAPVILDGDFILPALASQAAFAGVQNGGRVRALFIDEESEEQLLTNLRQREGHEQLPRRARVSWLYGRWLKEQAQDNGASVVPSRPWDTLFDRVLQVLA